MLYFVISYLIVGTFMSACKTFLDIYHGAFTIARMTLFWYLCDISLFELLAVSQTGRQLLLLRVVAANYFEKYMELVNTLGGHCVEILYVEEGGWCKNHRT